MEIFLNFQVVIHNKLDHNKMNQDIENDIYNGHFLVDKDTFKKKKNIDRSEEKRNKIMIYCGLNCCTQTTTVSCVV